jgi:hypothetical protein
VILGLCQMGNNLKPSQGGGLRAADDNLSPVPFVSCSWDLVEVSILSIPHSASADLGGPFTSTLCVHGSQVPRASFFFLRAFIPTGSSNSSTRTTTAEHVDIHCFTLDNLQS